MEKRQRNRLQRVLLTPLLIMILGACAGDMGTEGESKGKDATVDASLQQDSSPPQFSPDGSMGQDLGSDTQPPPPPTPDAAPPQPDTAPPPQTGGPGDPCPCTGANLCHEGVCRAFCTLPTDACKAVANCPSDHACIGEFNGKGLCLPAVQPGQACGTDAYCPVNHVCGSVNNSPFICLPVCSNPGGQCANGSLCMDTAEGCSFCTSP
jgi:hypothetical protein